MATQIRKSKFDLFTKRIIANEMIELYREVHDDSEVIYYLTSQEQEIADIRHCVRFFLAEKHSVGSSMIARSESFIWQVLHVGFRKPVNHATIINSFKVVKHTLPISRPAFTRRMKNLILGA